MDIYLGLAWQPHKCSVSLLGSNFICNGVRWGGGEGLGEGEGERGSTDSVSTFTARDLTKLAFERTESEL